MASYYKNKDYLKFIFENKDVNCNLNNNIFLEIDEIILNINKDITIFMDYDEILNDLFSECDDNKIN